MTEHEHPDIEGLSAYVDGEAPEWAEHVARCDACRASVDELRAVAGVVGTPVEPPLAAHRESAVAAALEDIDGRRHVRAGRPERRWALPAAAAVVVGILGFSALLAMGTRSTDQTTVAGPAPEAPAREALSNAGADSSAGGLAAADLGDVPDAASLVARARPALALAGPASAAAAESRSSSSPAPPAAPAPTAPSLNQRSPAPAVVGTRPCEEQARTREPTLREVVYFATARRGPTPGVVLGFATGPAPSPITLLLLAQDGCAELVRATTP